MKPLHSLLFALVISCNGVRGAFMQSLGCDVPMNDYLTSPFLMDIAIDNDGNWLKFFINSKAFNASNLTHYGPVITDLNDETNTFTTLHVQISFRGEEFINDSLRFCDLVAVKENPRRDAERPTVSPMESSPSDASIGYSTSTMAMEEEETAEDFYPSTREHSFSDDFANRNDSMEYIFNNSTGDLVQCPLYSNDSFVLYYEANISDHYNTWGSYTARFSIISNSNPSRILGCNKVYVTPIQNWTLRRFFSIGVIVAVVLCIIFNFIIVVWSEYQESSVDYLFMASTICNEKLLKQLEAPQSTLLPHLHFIFFMAGLNINYPGFFQPLMGTIKWCALLGIDFAYKGEPNKAHTSHMDNVYASLNGGGLKRLTYYTTSKPFHQMYINFVVMFVIWVSIMVCMQQVALLVRNSAIASKKLGKHFFSREVMLSNLTHTFTRYSVSMIVGRIFLYFLITFAFPLLALSFYVFLTASHKKYFPSIASLKWDAFNMNRDYDDLFKPPSAKSSKNALHGDVSSKHIAFNGAHSKSVFGHDYYVSENLSVAFAAIAVALWLGFISFFIGKFIFRIKRFRLTMSNNVSKLYTSIKNILLWGSLYNQYKPNKVYFVFIEMLFAFLRSIVVGLFANIGSVQVAVIVVIQASYLLLLFALKPHFLELSFVSPRVWLPVSQFVTILLCVPLIAEFDLSEEKRTYISYVQLLIHAIVVFFFLVHLFYCLVSTFTSSRKGYQSPTEVHRPSAVDADSVRTHSGFDYSFDTKFHSKGEDMKPLCEDSPSFNAHINGTDDEYYRSKSEKLLQKMFFKDDEHVDPIRIDASQSRAKQVSESSMEGMPLVKEQYGSSASNKDYTFREGDLIYRKYFCDDKIDPEVKELWDSRHSGTVAPRIPTDQDLHKSNIFGVFKKSKTPEDESTAKEFVVARPKKLVIKDQINSDEV